MANHKTALRQNILLNAFKVKVSPFIPIKGLSMLISWNRLEQFRDDNGIIVDDDDVAGQQLLIDRDPAMIVDLLHRIRTGMASPIDM